MLCQSIFIVSSTAPGIGGAKHDSFHPYGNTYGQVFREQRRWAPRAVTVSRSTQIPERWMLVFNISGLLLQNDCIESPELCIQTPDKVPVEVRPGINYKNDPIRFPCNRFISGF
jgi:hypothetical protein